MNVIVMVDRAANYGNGENHDAPHDLIHEVLGIEDAEGNHGELRDH